VSKLRCFKLENNNCIATLDCLLKKKRFAKNQFPSWKQKGAKKSSHNIPNSCYCRINGKKGMYQSMAFRISLSSILNVANVVQSSIMSHKSLSHLAPMINYSLTKNIKLCVCVSVYCRVSSGFVLVKWGTSSRVHTCCCYCWWWCAKWFYNKSLPIVFHKVHSTTKLLTSARHAFLKLLTLRVKLMSVNLSKQPSM
jgi:hypothetical protein